MLALSPRRAIAHWWWGEEHSTTGYHLWMWQIRNYYLKRIFQALTTSVNQKKFWKSSSQCPSPFPPQSLHIPPRTPIHSFIRHSLSDNYISGIKTVRRNNNNFRYADDTTILAENEEELKSLLMKVKEEREKAGLKFNIQKTKIMASSPITSGEIDGETVETVADLILGGSKITADGDCSHEIKDACSLEEKLWPT